MPGKNHLRKFEREEDFRKEKEAIHLEEEEEDQFADSLNFEKDEGRTGHVGGSHSQQTLE